MSISLNLCACGSESGAPSSREPLVTDRAGSAGESSRLRGELSGIRELISQGDHETARLHLQSLLAADPDDAQALFLWGLTFHRERRYGQARPHLERARDLMPGYHPVHHFYGWCTYYLGDLPTSRAAFEHHLQLVPSEADSHFALGLIELDEGNLDQAISRFRKAIELTENQEGRTADLSRAHARLGEALLQRGDLEGARRHLDLSTTLYPNHYEAFFILYRVLMRMGDEEAAEAALKAHDEAKQRVRPEHAESTRPE